MAQVEHYTIDHQTREHQPDADQNHPSLSSVPSPPGPELDPKHHHLDTHELPEPPVFSPPSTNTTFDDISFGTEELDSTFDSFSHPTHPPTVLDDHLSPVSPENTAGFIVEPQTPEAVNPHLDFIPSVTNDFEHITQPIGAVDLSGKPAPTQTHYFDQSSESLEAHSPPDLDSHPENTQSELTTTDSQDEPSLPGIGLSSSISNDQEQKSATQRTRDELDHLVSSHQLPPSSKPKEPQPKPIQSARQTQSLSDVEGWFDATKPEVQFALGLFAIPWSSLIVLSRSINQIWTIIFNEPIVRPISGLIPSIVAPSFLYGSLLALFIGALAQF